jgi:hypothetical protein
MSTFSKGRSAGAQLWAIINRVPEIDPDDESGTKLDKVRIYVGFSYHLSHGSVKVALIWRGRELGRLKI